MSRKLVVAGCSFSDRFQVDRCYGDILSQRLGFDYVHEARTCGSNTAIWRRITKHILEGGITEQDILLVQYTVMDRTEFATWKDPRYNDVVHEKYDDVTWLVRYKIDAETWHSNQTTAEFIRLYSQNFICPSYEDEKFVINNHNFQCMLAHHNINAFFLNLSCYAPVPSVWSVLEYFQDRVYVDRVETLACEPYMLSDKDPWHLSQAGHEKVSDDVYEFIKHRI